MPLPGSISLLTRVHFELEPALGRVKLDRVETRRGGVLPFRRRRRRRCVLSASEAVVPLRVTADGPRDDDAQLALEVEGNWTPPKCVCTLLNCLT